jgi:hypothetical protein
MTGSRPPRHGSDDLDDVIDELVNDLKLQRKNAFAREESRKTRDELEEVADPEEELRLFSEILDAPDYARVDDSAVIGVASDKGVRRPPLSSLMDTEPALKPGKRADPPAPRRPPTAAEREETMEAGPAWGAASGHDQPDRGSPGALRSERRPSAVTLPHLRTPEPSDPELSPIDDDAVSPESDPRIANARANLLPLHGKEPLLEGALEELELDLDEETAPPPARLAAKVAIEATAPGQHGASSRDARAQAIAAQPTAPLPLDQARDRGSKTPPPAPRASSAPRGVNISNQATAPAPPRAPSGPRGANIAKLDLAPAPPRAPSAPRSDPARTSIAQQATAPGQYGDQSLVPKPTPVLPIVLQDTAKLPIDAASPAPSIDAPKAAPRAVSAPSSSRSDRPAGAETPTKDPIPQPRGSSSPKPPLARLASDLRPPQIGAPPPPPPADSPAPQPPPETTQVGDLLQNAGIASDGPPPEVEMPTLVVRAEKVLERAREYRALKLQLGTTNVIEHDADAERARLAVIAEHRRQIAYRVLSAVGVVAIAGLLVFAVDVYRGGDADSESLEESSLAAAGSEPLPSPDPPIRAEAPAVDVKHAADTVKLAAAAAPVPSPPEGTAAREPTGAGAVAASSQATAKLIAEAEAPAKSTKAGRAQSKGRKASPHALAAAKPTKKAGRAKAGAEATEASKPTEPLLADRPGGGATEAAATVAAPPAPPPPPAPATPKLGYVEVKGPSGVAIEIDGAEIGKTPLETLAIAPGRYTVWASKKGFEVFTKDIHVEPGKTVAIDIKLTPIPSVGIDATK